MPWYTAECLYHSELIDASQSEQLCEYRYFLLEADDGQRASEKAWELAKRKQHSYLNGQGVRVNWLLEEVVATKELLTEGLNEGTEVYYKYFSRPLPER